MLGQRAAHSKAKFVTRKPGQHFPLEVAREGLNLARAFTKRPAGTVSLSSQLQAQQLEPGNPSIGQFVQEMRFPVTDIVEQACRQPSRLLWCEAQDLGPDFQKLTPIAQTSHGK